MTAVTLRTFSKAEHKSTTWGPRHDLGLDKFNHIFNTRTTHFQSNCTNTFTFSGFGNIHVIDHLARWQSLTLHFLCYSNIFWKLILWIHYFQPASDLYGDTSFRSLPTTTDVETGEQPSKRLLSVEFYRWRHRPLN